MADFSESGVERGWRIGFNIEVELIFKGPPVDGAAFDFLEVDTVAGEGFESGEKGAGLVSEAKSNGHFVGNGRNELRGKCFGDEQDKASEVFRIVVNVFGQDFSTVNFGGTAGGDSGKGFVSAGDDFADAAGGVFCGDTFQIGVRKEEFLALSEGYWV